MKKYYRVTAETDYACTRNEFLHCIEYESEEKFGQLYSMLEEEADCFCQENAENFEYLFSYDYDDTEDDKKDEALEDYYANATYFIEEITEEEYIEETE